MRIAGIYSFNKGKEVIEANFAIELFEIKEAIAGVDATSVQVDPNKQNAADTQSLPSSGCISSLEGKARSTKQHQGHEGKE